MWLLNATTNELEFFEGNRTPSYAILSHRWEDGEVSFKDVQERRHFGMRGFYKIQKCCEQALSNNLSYVWVDTCCINKESSAELSEAINSMYRWYKESVVCYGYLSDVERSLGHFTLQRGYDPSWGNNDGDDTSMMTQSLWFTRGWTLQELLACEVLMFYDSQWESLGTKKECRRAIQHRTGIPWKAIEKFVPNNHTILEKMTWAAERQTTRVEDRAYSLLGLFDVYMPLLYGEGERAFRRLQLEIMAVSNDTSIFAWCGDADPSIGMLACAPQSFTGRFRLIGRPELETAEEPIHKMIADREDGGGTGHSSFIRPYSLSKLAIASLLTLRPWTLNYFFVRLGTWWYNNNGELEGFEIGYFLERPSNKKTFHRVNLDGYSCAMIPMPERRPDFRSPFAQWKSKIEVEIEQTPLRNVRTRLDLIPKLDAYLSNKPRTVRQVTAGMHHFNGTRLQLRKAWSSPPKVRRRGRKDESWGPSLCLWYSSSQTKPDFVLHSGWDIHKKPAIFVTKPVSDEREGRQRASCKKFLEIDHICCETERVTLKPTTSRQSKLASLSPASKSTAFIQQSNAEPAGLTKKIDIKDVMLICIFEREDAYTVRFDFGIRSDFISKDHVPTSWRISPQKYRDEQRRITE